MTSDWEARRGRFAEACGKNDCAVISHRDETLVKESVEVGGEEEAVVDVEAFGVGGAVGPWFDVAGAEEFRDGQAGDGAAATPILHEAVAKDVLADALHHQPLGFRGPRQARRFFLEKVQEFVRQAFA
jgi:hypothetical protein